MLHRIHRQLGWYRLRVHRIATSGVRCTALREPNPDLSVVIGFEVGAIGALAHAA